MLEWIQYAIFGLVAGAIARFLHPGRDPMNWLWTMLLGIGGAVVGGFVGDKIGVDTSGGLASWIAAVVGAIGLLLAYHFMTARKASASTSTGGSATGDDYKKAVFDDLSRGPNG